jgi:hypothetical protein
MSHGWGSNVLVVLQRWVLGVQPVAPGYADFRVIPSDTSRLASVSGTVPTPAGIISVHWERAHGGFTIDLYVPPNTAAIVGSQHVGAGYHVLHLA